MQPSVPNSLLRSDLDGKGLLPQVTQASHSEHPEDDQYRGGQGGVMNVLVYRQGTTNCLVSHKTIMRRKGDTQQRLYWPADTPISPAFCEDSGRPSIMARRRQAALRLSPCLTGRC